MDVKVVLDWKSFLALGGAAVALVLVNKLGANGAEHVLTHAVDACKELAIASNSNC